MISKQFLLGFLGIAVFCAHAPAGSDGEPPAESVVEAESAGDELTAEDFFRASAISNATLCPDGSKVAYANYQGVVVGNPGSGFTPIFKFSDAYSITGLTWSGNDVLIAEAVKDETGEQAFVAMAVSRESDGYKASTKKEFRLRGYILDPLTDESDYVIYARIEDEKESSFANLYRINLFGRGSQTNNQTLLNRGMEKALFFVLDQNDEPVAGLGYEDSAPRLYAKTDKKNDWQLIWSGPKDTEFRPAALSADGKTLWALSNATTDRVAAVEFDMAKAKIARTLYEHDTYDLIAMTFPEGAARPTGVIFLESGKVQYEFFDASDKADLLTLQRLLPGERMHITGATQDRSVLLVIATSPQSPETYYICKPADESCEKLSSAQPWLAQTELAETRTLSTPSSDGFEVKAFLTLPNDSGRPIPLIVMPHGGPIDVQENAYFSSDVQWLANNGYAVLQVDYRGSAGYGKRFKSAGLQQWGRGIEDDIEASLDNALASYPILDRTRVGIYGISYGGYSALQSIIRNSERYQCAASFAGVTDLTLLFNAPQIRKNEKVREELIKIVGDPEIEKQELMQYSPVYNYRKILKPVFIAHGTADTIVDIEHSWRLKKMLELAGVEPEFHVFLDVGHGFATTTEAKALYDPLIEFLDSHLK